MRSVRSVSSADFAAAGLHLQSSAVNSIPSAAGNGTTFGRTGRVREMRKNMRVSFFFFSSFNISGFFFFVRPLSAMIGLNYGDAGSDVGRQFCNMIFQVSHHKYVHHMLKQEQTDKKNSNTEVNIGIRTELEEKEATLFLFL